MSDKPGNYGDRDGFYCSPTQCRDARILAKVKEFVETTRRMDEYRFKEEGDDDERFFPGRISSYDSILAEIERLEREEK